MENICYAADLGICCRVRCLLQKLFKFRFNLCRPQKCLIIIKNKQVYHFSLSLFGLDFFGFVSTEPNVLSLCIRECSCSPQV